MSTRQALILVPGLITAFLLQSYFWVPTYEQQTKGNPQRLTGYITASSGDASILNPILSADSASSTIESMVFEGLLDRDEDLHFRGRLATSWEISEEAFFYWNQDAVIPGQGRLTPRETVDFLNTMLKDSSLPSPVGASLANIEEISLLAPRQFVVEKSPKEADSTNTTSIMVSPPPRIQLSLKTVDQNLFDNLQLILGSQYFSSFRSDQYLSIQPLEMETQKTAYAEELLPATEHNPTVVFHLRSGVLFHDGHEFDAGDVKFTFEAIMNPKNLSPRISDYEPVKSVSVLDPRTVKVIYKRLYSPALGTWAMGILPEHLLNEEALRNEAVAAGREPESFTLRQSGLNRKPVGCGPFTFAEWESDQYITLHRFEDYWEGRPNYERYTFRIIPDLLTQEMEFYAGTIDNYSVQPHQVERLANDERFQKFSGNAFGYTYIGYNMRREPFNDVRVRRALGMAIDVDKIIEYVLYGQGERMTGPFVKQTDYYNHTIAPLPFDPDAALELLKEAGYRKNSQGWLEKDGKKLQFTLITNNGNDLRKAMLTIAQNNWKKIGIDVRTDVLEWSVFIQKRVNNLDFDALILGWSMGIEPDLFQIWHSTQTNPYQLNFVGFHNEQADDLIIKIRQEYDEQKQAAYSHELHAIIADEQPYTFLYASKWTAVLDKRIVLQDQDASGNRKYSPIQPTKTGNYSFYFNKWIKLPEIPTFSPEG